MGDHPFSAQKARENRWINAQNRNNRAGTRRTYSNAQNRAGTRRTHSNAQNRAQSRARAQAHGDRRSTEDPTTWWDSVNNFEKSVNNFVYNNAQYLTALTAAGIGYYCGHDLKDTVILTGGAYALGKMGKRDFTNLDPTVSRTRLRRRRLVTMERLLKSITSLNSCTRRHADAKADRGRR